MIITQEQSAGAMLLAITAPGESCASLGESASHKDRPVQ